MTLAAAVDYPSGAVGVPIRNSATAERMIAFDFEVTAQRQRAGVQAVPPRLGNVRSYLGSERPASPLNGRRVRMSTLRVLRLSLALAAALTCCAGAAQDAGRQPMFETDTLMTEAGELKITCVGHGTLMFTFGDTLIHVDPVSREADYGEMPKADLILVTHEHGDHLDPGAIAAVRQADTLVILTEKCAAKVPGGTVMRNGDVRTAMGLEIEAVPAYNIVHKRPSGDPFHPRGDGNGYVITFGDTRVYVAGDTENTPEMKALKDIDVAFLPMNLPYTMTPEMVADAARAFRPKVLYPYHFGSTDTSELVRLLEGVESIEVRIRKMQ
jgi:L-ascorbate metabolism protein UlaG (beta-lactamase superfamily)